MGLISIEKEKSKNSSHNNKFINKPPVEAKVEVKKPIAKKKIDNNVVNNYQDNSSMDLNYLNGSINSYNNFNNTSTNTNNINNAGMSGDKIKTEGSLVGSIIGVSISSIIKITLFCLVIGLLFYFLREPLKLFIIKSEYSVARFNKELYKVYGLVGGAILLFNLFLMIFIKGSVKRKFKYKYLSKINVYIFEGFMVLLCILLYLVGLILAFKGINYLIELFKVWVSTNRITGSIKFKILNSFKYLEVILGTIFLVLSCYDVISITHKKNEFILNGEV